MLFHFRPDNPSLSPCCYDTVVSESRIVDYIGIGRRQLPDKAYYGRWRTFPDTCDYSFEETKPAGVWRSYFGVDVFEGAYEYNDTRLVPSWGGSMFEALMPALFVPEESWARDSWGENHPLTVAAQVFHGMHGGRLRVWGFSPADNPDGGYAVWGVDGAGMDPGGMPSNVDRTLVDHGFPGCPDRPGVPDPPPSAYTNGVVTPHAAFLALRYAPHETKANLRRLARDFPGLYGRWGFRDSVNVQTWRVSDAYLSLDQGMIMAALGNALGHDVLRRAFADRRARARTAAGDRGRALRDVALSASAERDRDLLQEIHPLLHAALHPRVDDLVAQLLARALHEERERRAPVRLGEVDDVSPARPRRTPRARPRRPRS